MTGSTWVPLGGFRSSSHQLFLFPCAGGGVGSVAPLARELAKDFEVSALRLPGRESQLAQSPLTQLDGAVNLAAEQLDPLLTDRPTILFGHSFGALLAYLVFHRLGQPSSVDLLVVAARQAPHLPSDGAALQGLTDSELLAALNAAGGIPDGIRQGNLAGPLLSVLRADMSLDDQHTHDAQLPPVHPHILGLSGLWDPWVAPHTVDAWRDRAETGFTHLRVEAGHFFLTSHAAVISRRLAALRDGYED
ncbi:thioesterase II family protein [Streptomyces canus]|uniref:thioesterase II family protein n=1 Tax=Streptomyces canus TaxID=58343 RepID=UPI0038662AC2|nr:alpha/beta fold hydrolase [Streptomyces canus]